ncbi:hypothetical protein HGM15179_002454 [Zosterops borbonicus]|uniref:Uncharacterized protein n=1 Tax=Zosterops borbonicus TaxID=364589 RepID=A0A8K1LSS5_9PASS|nr:hypothetical protein HGM15179_002454 [Zosterops borbonicus]
MGGRMLSMPYLGAMWKVSDGKLVGSKKSLWTKYVSQQRCWVTDGPEIEESACVHICSSREEGSPALDVTSAHLQSHVHVPVQYKLTKRLVEPLSDPQLQGTDPAPKVEPMQHLLIFQESDQKLELVKPTRQAFTSPIHKEVRASQLEAVASRQGPPFPTCDCDSLLKGSMCTSDWSMVQKK